ncbi:MAG: PDZ domain-containing protein [Anaerolineaceae bacterium]|nr:PDZ domain-containing protein [Anaerolineaceae bacterium]
MEPQNLPSSSRNATPFLFQFLLIILSIGIGAFGYRLVSRYRGDLALLQEARAIVENNTILDIPEDTALEYGMIRGMLAELNDPYTYFVEPAAHEVESNDLSGSFGGIGARLERDTDLNWRLYPLPDSPSLAAGLMDGDIIVAIDDLTITTETDDITLLAAVRGPVGDPLNITVQRGEETLTVTLHREAIAIPSVTWNVLPEAATVGILHVYRIAETTADEVQSGITDLQGQGAKAFILDLRNNGGGLVDSAVDIARLFLSEGDVLHEQFKGESENVYQVKSPGAFTDLPLVVLVNEYTASSAEILAGALSAQGRALLIGAPTYGKTTIQYIFDLQDGSSVHVTSGRWWIPGVDFPLQPDIPVTDDPNGTVIIQTAIEQLGQY